MVPSVITHIYVRIYVYTFILFIQGIQNSRGISKKFLVDSGVPHADWAWGFFAFYINGDDLLINVTGHSVSLSTLFFVPLVCPFPLAFNFCRADTKTLDFVHSLNPARRFLAVIKRSNVWLLSCAVALQFCRPCRSHEPDNPVLLINTELSPTDYGGWILLAIFTIIPPSPNKLTTAMWKLLSVLNGGKDALRRFSNFVSEQSRSYYYCDCGHLDIKLLCNRQRK